MKKHFILLGLSLCLVSCQTGGGTSVELSSSAISPSVSSSVETSSSSSTSNSISSSLSSSSQEISLEQEFNKLLRGYQLDVVMTDSSTEPSTKSGLMTSYGSDDAVSFYGISNIGFNENNEIIYGTPTYCLSDKSGEQNGYAYQETLGVDNIVHKSYLHDNEGNLTKFSDSFTNVFSDVEITSLYKVEEGKYGFRKAEDRKKFITQFTTGSIASSLQAYFEFSEGVLKDFKVTSQNAELVINIVLRGEEVKYQPIKPFIEDQTDKSDLTAAISKLGNNYTVTHYRTNAKTITYYDGDEIIWDFNADGLGKQDCFYYPNQDNLMERSVYGQKNGIGITSFDANNYTEMSYQTLLSYRELGVRLDQINLGLFHNNGDGTYSNIEGSQSLVSPYCQPTPNVRALYIDDAISVKISVKDQSIEKIVLSYVYDPYGSGGFTKNDTIFFTEVGTTTFSKAYQEATHQDQVVPNDQILGTWSNLEDKPMYLTLNSNLTATYQIGEMTYNVAKYYYYETDERINISFEYDDAKRFVSLGYDKSGTKIEGFDSAYINTYEDFFNLTLTKSN